jgi:ABC transporter substrate binding protein (PQQ-dependent alcohol dehydrogenase system)
MLSSLLTLNIRKYAIGVLFLRVAFVVLTGLLSQSIAQAQSITIGIYSRATDERLDPRVIEANFLQQPGGRAIDGIKVALAESEFELNHAKITFKLIEKFADSLVQAGEQLQAAEKEGLHLVIVDWPAAWVAAHANKTRLAMVNVGENADSLREQDCRPNVFHTIPSLRMQQDAIAQTLVARRWSKLLVLHSELPDDQVALSGMQSTLNRYRLKPIATRIFKLSADPRDREKANVSLLTSGVDYDAIWVVDTQGDFARSLPYRGLLARPVVGSAGLVSEAWHKSFDRYGAPQLSRRFLRTHQRPMTSYDWAAWVSAKATIQAALIAFAPNAQPAVSKQVNSKPIASGLLAALLSKELTVDGFKGTALSFRTWDRQLRQPMLLTDGQAILQMAPIEGILHPTNVLDTLGADMPEKRCKAGA